MWCVYVLQCADGTLYTGITKDLESRLRSHTQGTGAKYTRGRGPFTVLHQECCASKGEALQREHAIKALRREDKLKLGSTARA
ncbi:MAG: endonuclease [Azospirillum brasilense]|nr:MAG: endonuclease [Azospirillum brasilense]